MPHTPQFLRRHPIRPAAVRNLGWPGWTARPQYYAGSGHRDRQMEKSDVVELLKTGTTPEQNKVKGAMRETIQDGLKYLSDADLEAIADYLFGQPPIVHDVTPNH